MCIYIYSITLSLQAVVVEEGKAENKEKKNSKNTKDQRDVKAEWFAALRAGDVVKVDELLAGGAVDVNATDEVSNSNRSELV